LAVDGQQTVGLLTLRFEGDECEILTVDAFVQGRGIGRALLEESFQSARAKGCRRAWLITTNDNLAAIAFYQKCGMQLVAIYPDAVTEARKLKPQIPLVAENGIPIRDEVEFEVQL
jgi:ribosomal protein S18 acetylase RimI-like enzyme